MEDFKYRSAYEFHHAQDNESILKSYKTSEWGNIKSTLSGYSWNFILFYLVSYIFERLVLTKGQIQTPPYRFLAKQGGYAWVQTQATVVSVSNQYFRSQAVVCIHTRLRCVS
jgi:hypoxia-inducible factor 1 alpha